MHAKETECTKCGHKNICAIKKEFLAAQKAIDSATYGTGGNEIMRVCDNKDFVVTLRCNHHIPDQQYRAGSNGQKLRGK